ncbi:MAG: ABC transporter substrate-binding protein [Anaerolineae bacterium]
MRNLIVRQRFLIIAVLVVGLGLIAAQCGAQPAEPQVIERVVTQEVQVVVTKEVEVEKIVTKEVEVEKIVTQEVEVEVEVPADIAVVRINMGYIPDPQYAPFYVGVEKGYFAEEGIQIVTDYSTEVDGIELLAAGEADFATGSGDLLLQARSQGLPIVYVLRWYNGIPAAIFSLKEAGIDSPEDLKGKTVGIPGFFGINYKSWLAFLEANGLTSDDVTLEAIGFAQVASVSEGQVDAAVGYSNNEPVQMMVQGMDVNVIELAPYNNFVPIGIMTTETMIAERPEVVQGFVRAFLRSVKATLDDPDYALDAVVRAVQFSGGDARPITQATLSKAMEFWTPVDGKFGYYDAETFEWSQEFLLAAGEMDTEIDVSQAFTNEFVENAQP